MSATPQLMTCDAFFLFLFVSNSTMVSNSELLCFGGMPSAVAIVKCALLPLRWRKFLGSLPSAFSSGLSYKSTDSLEVNFILTATTVDVTIRPVMEILKLWPQALCTSPFWWYSNLPSIPLFQPPKNFEVQWYMLLGTSFNLKYSRNSSARQSTI